VYDNFKVFALLQRKLQPISAADGVSPGIGSSAIRIFPSDSSLDLSGTAALLWQTAAVRKWHSMNMIWNDDTHIGPQEVSSSTRQRSFIAGGSFLLLRSVTKVRVMTLPLILQRAAIFVWD
jgi:hypothetical protein